MKSVILTQRMYRRNRYIKRKKPNEKHLRLQYTVIVCMMHRNLEKVSILNNTNLYWEYKEIDRVRA